MAVATSPQVEVDPFGGRQTSVICDAHPMWLDAVELVLRRTGVEVVAKTTSPLEAVALAERHRPDLLITALEQASGELSGLVLIERSRAAVPAMRLIVLSIHADRETIDAAFAAGASAYVVKTASPEDLASAVRQTFSHSVYLPGRPPAASPPVRPSVAHEPALTRRELEILRLVAEGHSNAQLARMLWVTEQTVKFHLSNIYRKLEVANRTEASRWAQVHGLLDGRPSTVPTALAS
jgi:DNA-binding NarL/FixJ family response regulator